MFSFILNYLQNPFVPGRGVNEAGSVSVIMILDCLFLLFNYQRFMFVNKNCCFFMVFGNGKMCKFAL